MQRLLLQWLHCSNHANMLCSPQLCAKYEIYSNFVYLLSVLISTISYGNNIKCFFGVFLKFLHFLEFRKKCNVRRKLWICNANSGHEMYPLFTEDLSWTLTILSSIYVEIFNGFRLEKLGTSVAERNVYSQKAHIVNFRQQYAKGKHL